MKIYHKFLLYQNKLLKPYVRILLGLIEALTYLASLSLIVGVDCYISRWYLLYSIVRKKKELFCIFGNSYMGSFIIFCYC